MSKRSVRYKYECGCIVDKPYKDNRGKITICEIHAEELQSKIYLCPRCKEWVERSKKTRTFAYCDECKASLGKKLYRHGDGNESMESAEPRNPDCRFYPKCLVDILPKNPRACQGCTRYVKQELRADEFLNNTHFSEHVHLPPVGGKMGR